MIPTEAVDTAQNVTFTNNDARESVHIYSEPDASFGSGMTSDANLGSFLSRPVRINTATWQVNSDLSLQFNPWQLYLEDPQVQRKLANFKLLRGTLEVSAYINASAFYAGNALVSYEPLSFGRNFPLQNFDNVSFLTRASQLPRFTLVSTKSKGGSMHLPFMFQNNWFNIPEQDWNNMGTIIVRSYSNLVNANEATDPINIVFFARMTNVDICMPTSYVAESGEYTEGGVISKPASYISSIAGALQSVPIIKPYAIATQMIADAAAGVARIFGYSRPRILERDCIVHPRFIGELAVTDQDEVRFSLAADSKRELTIDPRTVGLSGVDEMVISNIAEKETFLTSFTWSVNDNIDTVLWSTFVHPQLSVVDTVANSVQTTALGAATAPFTYWCGGLKFRFVLARPATYQGRMTISFDGQGPPGADYNTHYRNVVDIQDNDDFSVTLPWAAAKPFLKTLVLNPAILTNLYGAGARDPLLYDSELYNGVLDVRVGTRIAATSSLTPDISVYVFVSAAPDFQVHRLTSDNYNKITYYDPESGLIESNVDDINEHQAQTNMGHSIMNTDPNAIRVNIGERVISLRAALKRYNLTTIYCNDAIPNGENRRWTIGDVSFPEFRGKTFNPISTTSGGEPYCFNNTTLLTYIAPAFVGWRGSLNFKDIYTTLDNRFQSPMIVTTDKGINGDFTIRPAGTSNPLNVLNVNQGTATDYVANDFSSLGNGSALTEMTVQPCLPYEVPWYANVRFSLVGYDEGQYHTINVYGRSPNTAATDQLFRFQSIGEDFNFFFWTGLPPMYYTPDDP